ncbi:MAG: hypothetical protein S4CHLAM102_16510 [Chlamydiia bacterium]|nr:hypothetical protein [Chlamydiia bacterium]
MKRQYFITALATAAMYMGGVFANIGPDGFGPFKQNYFVETGSMGGDAVIKALNSGFKYASTIEAYKPNYTATHQRFIDDTRVKVYFGDSSKDLWKMIKDIREPITFWLDAHVFPPVPGELNCPVIEELEQIKRHPIKDHIILIDDLHCCGSQAFDFLTREDFVEKLYEINPDYVIFRIPGGDKGEVDNNIMVACPPHKVPTKYKAREVYP